jgi:hypothetical protein
LSFGKLLFQSRSNKFGSCYSSSPSPPPRSVRLGEEFVSEPGHRLDEEFVPLQLMVATAALGSIVDKSGHLDGEFDPFLSMVTACGQCSGGLPTRPTRPGLGAPKARGPPRLGGPKVGGPQGSPAQLPQRAGAHKAWKSPGVGAPRIGGPQGLGGHVGSGAAKGFRGRL